MEYRFLRVHEAEAIVHVMINRPDKRNALSEGVLAELGHCFAALAGREDLLAATLRGAGERCFAAGGDLHEVDALRSRADAERFARECGEALDAIREFPLPVYGLLNGDAIGGGAELAMACDVRIAAPHARIGFAQATLNISPAWGGGSDLVRTVGAAQAVDLLARADFVSAHAALARGLVQALCPAEHAFDTFVVEYLAPIRERKVQVMRAIKALALAHRRADDAADIRAVERAHLVTTWCHADHWSAHDRVLARIAGRP